MAEGPDLARFGQDAQYYETHQQEFLKVYPEQWVAIFNQRVVGANSDARQLLADLHARGIPIEKALVEHVTEKDELLILAS